MLWLFAVSHFYLPSLQEHISEKLEAFCGGERRYHEHPRAQSAATADAVWLARLSNEPEADSSGALRSADPCVTDPSKVSNEGRPGEFRLAV